MKIVRGRADARWLPSRHNFALFRLGAYLRLRSARPEVSDAIYVIDRHQSATETWLVQSWLIATVACYVAATLFSRLHLAVALLIALPLTFACIDVPALISAIVIAPFVRNPHRVNGAVVMLIPTVASLYYATRPTWLRFVAWQFLGVLALNAIAALIVFAMRDSIARLEGGVTSAP